MEQGAKIALVGKDETMSVQENSVGTADQRREQMLLAALDVIAERGYADSRIADVAEHAGTSPALVIYYFKTKDQLLTEAIRFSEDNWYEAGTRRMAEIPTAAGKLEELVAMTYLPEADAEPGSSWVLWLDLWAQAARHPEVASVRQKDDERWRQLICSLVVAGQEAGEFGPGRPGGLRGAVVRAAGRARGADRAGRPGGDREPCLRAEHAVRRRAARLQLDTGPEPGGLAGAAHAMN